MPAARHDICRTAYTLRLIVFDMDDDTGAKSVKDIKEQDVFMGDMPLMTPNGRSCERNRA
jgi:DNA-directed RNA polymerase beta subunit